MKKTRVLAKKRRVPVKNKKSSRKVNDDEEMEEIKIEIVQDKDQKQSDVSDEDEETDETDDDSLSDESDNDKNDDDVEMKVETVSIPDNRKRKMTTVDEGHIKKTKTGEPAFLVIAGVRENTSNGAIKTFFKRKKIDVEEIIRVPGKGIMYLIFESERLQLKALKCNGKKLKGSRIKLEKIKSIPSSGDLSHLGERNNELVVKNLSPATREDELRKLFKGCKSVRMISDLLRPIGTAIVEYEKIEDAEAGMKEVNEKEVDGKKLYVCFATKRKKKRRIGYKKEHGQLSTALKRKLQEKKTLKRLRKSQKKISL